MPRGGWTALGAEKEGVTNTPKSSGYPVSNNPGRRRSRPRPFSAVIRSARVLPHGPPHAPTTSSTFVQPETLILYHQ